MGKEELDRRCAEMKARTLAQRAAHVQKQPSGVTERTSTAKAKRDHSSSTTENSDGQDELRNQIARLEAENHNLRQQIAVLTSSAAGPPHSEKDSVREQQHNFFKYSNIRRY